jgi:hypothetical protein
MPLNHLTVKAPPGQRFAACRAVSIDEPPSSDAEPAIQFAVREKRQKHPHFEEAPHVFSRLCRKSPEAG